MIRYGIIGAGLVGRKRAAALKPGQLGGVYDVDFQHVKNLLAASRHGEIADSPDAIFQDKTVDAVIIATPHDSLAALALRAIQAGKHVLIEKPAARSSAELAPLLAAARDAKVCVRVGYNHRFHPSLVVARSLVDKEEIGPLFLIRGRYGHGGRIGYETEWRAQQEISGGGELIDQGVHLVDLARWFLGDFARVRGKVSTLFWQMPVEDNAFLELETAQGATAWLHASCSEWKNLFSLEIYGRHGKLQLDGLGGSYGPETMVHYRMKPEMGPPLVAHYDFAGDDLSWRHELAAFENDIATGTATSCTLEEAEATLRIVDEVYRQNPRA